MDKKTKVFIYGGLIIIFLMIICLVTLYVGSNSKKGDSIDASGVLITKDENLKYSVELVKSYSEYEALLKKYNLKDIMFLTNSSFDENDYIVDFLDYNDNLAITNISLGKNEEGILDTITYEVNEKVSDSKKNLMYFIPVSKNEFTGIDIKSKSIILAKSK